MPNQSLKVLSESDVEQFIERGWVKVPEAFSRQDALAAQQVVWSHVEERGVIQSDKSSWTEPMVHIRESYRTPEFDACNTERLANAIEDLVGEGRWAHRGQPASWGWWPVNFGLGKDGVWDVPTSGWHWDGIQFRHFVDSPDQGLLCLCMFSEIGHHGGGTLVVEGSHKVVARYLSTQPEGVELHDGIRAVNQGHPFFAALTGKASASMNGAAARRELSEVLASKASSAHPERVQQFMESDTVDQDGISLRVIETTASPGDVILCHPFLYHAASQNHSGVPRFMCNRTTPLKERLNLQQGADSATVLERSIQAALAQ